MKQKIFNDEQIVQKLIEQKCNIKVYYIYASLHKGTLTDYDGANDYGGFVLNADGNDANSTYDYAYFLEQPQAEAFAKKMAEELKKKPDFVSVGEFYELNVMEVEAEYGYGRDWEDTNIMDVVDFSQAEEVDQDEYYYVEPTYKPLAGAILITWSWDRYVGYARKFDHLEHVSEYDNRTEEDITDAADKVFCNYTEVIMWADDAKAAHDDGTLESELTEKLLSTDTWKWRNPTRVRNAIKYLADNFDYTIGIKGDEPVDE